MLFNPYKTRTNNKLQVQKNMENIYLKKKKQA